MKNLGIVTGFTIKEMLRRKSFIFSTLVLLIIIVLAFNIPNIMNMFGTDSLNEKVLVIDPENLFEGQVEYLNNMELGYTFEITTEDLTQEQIKQKVENDIDACIKFTNITPEEIAAIEPQFDVELIETDENAAKGNVAIMMIISLVLFYAIIFCAQQVSVSITTEKTSKIIETLVTSTDSKTIVLGKTLGIGIVGLVQIILMITVAIISAKFFMDPEILNTIFDLSSITPKLVILTLIYFCFGYALYSLGFALTGSTVSKPEDVQYANGPISVIAVIGFYLSYFSMMNPSSNMNQIAGIVPISSPFSMPLRVMMGTATNSEIAISLIILVVTTVLLATIAIKVYSSTILNTGARLKLKDAIKMAKENK